MIQRERLDTAQVPGGATLELYRHDRDHMIVIGNNELMSTRKWGSEEALAAMSLERIKGVKRPHLLIGGYGMGFTLRAALRVLPEDACVTVVELVPKIIEWARGPMADLAGGCLEDPRVELVMADVAVFIAGAEREYDAILLDVDNGPDGLVRADNDGLYTPSGLREAKRALTPGGVLAIWSAAPDPAFSRRLTKCGFAVDEVRVASRSNGKGPKHVIWFAAKR
ncbi:spermidine synthase [Novosphingobium sp. PC22D]|uniref:spermidine synthase n=1 Tax=Novosphingobium sp. PC22D TaxID=1962403 RepID=UPI000BF16FDA|nr:spermidine synthase [Novosphingobium sp. PC22D]PEQ12283.1 spermidine synthase [Novosphingobium sp. PC22D]